MPITEKQVLKRQSHLGSSDIPVLVGLSPWKSVYDLWLEKTGQVEPFQANAAMEAGNIFENAVLDWASQQIGKLKRNQFRVGKNGIIKGNIDAISLDKGYPVEAKTAGLFSPLPKDAWGEPGTDQVPPHVILQCHSHMYVTEKSLCYVPAFLGGRGFQLYIVNRNDKIVDYIVRESEKFWRQYVELKIPPEDKKVSLDTLKRIIREPNKVVNINGHTVAQWQKAKQILKSVGKIEKELKAEVLRQLDDAEVGQFEGGHITYYEIQRNGYTVKPTRYRKLNVKIEGDLLDAEEETERKLGSTGQEQLNELARIIAGEHSTDTPETPVAEQDSQDGPGSGKP